MVTFYNGNNLIGGTPTYTLANATATSYASLTATLTAYLTANASITATYSGDANYQGSTSPAVPISISGGTPDFSLAATPPSFIITSPGQSGTTTISASALNNFNGTLNVTCSLQATMTYSTCSFSSPSFSVQGGFTVLTVNTTAASTALRLFDRPRWLMPSAGALFACILLLLVPRKKRRVELAFGLLVFTLLAALVACGGSSSSGTTHTPGTPTGNYTVTVTGTSSNLSHTLNVPVTVE
jgi:hypothetical protein